jgi:hypothetical protein
LEKLKIGKQYFCKSALYLYFISSQKGLKEGNWRMVGCYYKHENFGIPKKQLEGHAHAVKASSKSILDGIFWFGKYEPLFRSDFREFRSFSYLSC